MHCKRRGQASTSSKPVDAPQTPPQHSTPLHETPISKKVSGATPYTSLHYKRDKRMDNLGSEMKGKFAGPMCPKEFLQVFLPFKRRVLQKMPKRMKKPFRRVAEQGLETAMYEPMIDALSPYSPGFDLVDTHRHRDVNISKNEPEIKPDVSLYIAGCRRDLTTVTDISLIDIHMEFKIDPRDDPFRDSPENNGLDDGNLPFENNTLASADTMGQITCYVTQQLASQFRTHAFSVLICKDRARLIHWDRSGAVVTRSFSYVEEPWLAKFFWRYTHSSPAVRGVDESVTVPTDADAIHVQKARAALGLDDDTPMFKFTIYGEDGGDVFYCFGNKPWFKGTGSPTGRATRVFTVYSPDLDKPVLMKDTWRVSLPGVQTEGVIYRRLHAANVSHIARFVRGGDVVSPFCRTRSHKFAKRFGLKFRPHSHYRFILEDIGRDLTSFATTKELVDTLADALQGHTEAVENAQILHRDISVGNVIISDRGGLLIDWDLAKDIKDLDKIARQPFRTGTWQFIAARLLQARESAAHTPADDWESFFHVLSWVVLRFTKHGLTSAELTNELKETYDSSYLDSGKVFGGVNKRSRIKSRFICTDAQIPPGPLLDLLKDLVDVCAVRYEDAPPREEQDEYDLLLQKLVGNPSLTHFLAKLPIKAYNNRKEKLKASWMLGRFRDAVKSGSWDGPEGQRHENTLVRVEEVVVTTKRPSEFETDIPRQSKRFKLTVDGGDNAALDDVEEEASECTDSEDEDEHDLDDYVVVGKLDQAETDWEDDEGELVDRLSTDSESA